MENAVDVAKLDALILLVLPESRQPREPLDEAETAVLRGPVTSLAFASES